MKTLMTILIAVLLVVSVALAEEALLGAALGGL